MTLIALNRFVFGLIATAVGLAFWLAAPKAVTVAGDVTTYTSTWKATEYLIAKRTFRGLGNLRPNNAPADIAPPTFDAIIIGVATWRVTGKFGPNGPYFKEDWQSPASRPVFTKNQEVSGVEPGEWIAGAIWVKNLETYPIEITKERFDEQIVTRPGDNATVQGNTASCVPRSNRCIFTTGAYGWTDYHDFESAGKGKHRTTGVAIPTLWTVTGTVCQLETDIDCQ